MTTLVDLANRALSEIGARATLTAINNSTPQGQQVGIWIDPIRAQLLRMAPWGFARRTLALTLLGQLTDNPPASPYPWQFKYAYPTDCIRVNYILPKPPMDTTNTPVVGVPLVPYAMPSRNCRYLVANDIDDDAEQTKVLLSNVRDAVGVYVADVTDPDLMDQGFLEAWVAALASKLVQPLTGNAGMKEGYERLAQMHINQARVSDANEAVPSADATPDWIATRGVPAYNAGWAGAPFMGGMWYTGYDSGNWGM
jgi:hypothetical protein